MSAWLYASSWVDSWKVRVLCQDVRRLTVLFSQMLLLVLLSHRQLRTVCLDTFCECLQVCFAMYMPNLVKFFLYSCHLSGSLLVDGMIALLSSEIHCARNFCRNFFWTSKLLLFVYGKFHCFATSGVCLSIGLGFADALSVLSGYCTKAGSLQQCCITSC